MGRPNKYDSHIKPYLKQIAEWKRNGATDDQICEQLDVSKSVYYDAKAKYPEFSEVLKVSKEKFVSDLRGELARIAFKHTLKTTKRVIKPTGTDEDGNPTYSTHIEETEKEVDGDIAALHLLLKNYDKENWSDKPRELDLKQQELELRRMLAEAREFDFGNIDTKDG